MTSIFAALFGVMTVFAASATLELSVTNPDQEVRENVVASFNFPDCATPVNLSSGMSWDPATRTLVIKIGNLAGNETKVIPIEAEVTDDCSFTGNITGEWSSSGTQTTAPVVQPPPRPFRRCRYFFSCLGERIGRLFRFRPQPTEISESAGALEPSAASQPVSFFEELNFLPQPVADVVRDLRENPEVKAVNDQVAAPVETAAAAASAVAVATSAATASSHILYIVIDHLRLLFYGFLRVKKRVPWGKVINEWTRQPVFGATVSVVDPTFQRVRETQVSDQEGRFGFLVTPGRYYLKINRSGFEVQQTGIFDAGENAGSLNLEVVIKPISGEWQRALGIISLFWNLLNRFLAVLNPYFLVAGTLLSVITLLITPTRFNLAVLISYLVLDAAKIAFSLYSVRSYGLVVDRQTKLPIPLGVVRVYSADQNRLVNTKVSNDRGRFNFLIVPGNYYLTCYKGNYDEYRTQPFEVKKSSLLNQTLALSPSNSASQTLAPSATQS